MNFLAHLHLASLAKSSLLGNLVADFVRGNPQSHYSATVVEGIMMHRRLDVLVDQLAAVKAARQLFKPDYYRIAPVTLDIVWDHFLAKHWQQYNPAQSLALFIQHVETTIQPELANTPIEFQRMNYYLWHERWLERYADLDFIAGILRAMQQRRPKLFGLADSIDVVKIHYTQLQEIFAQFYPDMIEQARRQLL